MMATTKRENPVWGLGGESSEESSLIIDDFSYMSEPASDGPDSTNKTKVSESNKSEMLGGHKISRIWFDRLIAGNRPPSVDNVELHPYYGHDVNGPSVQLAKINLLLTNGDSETVAGWRQELAEFKEYLAYLYYNYRGEAWGGQLGEAIEKLYVHWLYERSKTPAFTFKSRKTNGISELRLGSCQNSSNQLLYKADRPQKTKKRRQKRKQSTRHKNKKPANDPPDPPITQPGEKSGSKSAEKAKKKMLRMVKTLELICLRLHRSQKRDPRPFLADALDILTGSRAGKKYTEFGLKFRDNELLGDSFDLANLRSREIKWLHFLAESCITRKAPGYLENGICNGKSPTDTYLYLFIHRVEDMLENVKPKVAFHHDQLVSIDDFAARLNEPCDESTGQPKFRKEEVVKYSKHLVKIGILRMEPDEHGTLYVGRPKAEYFPEDRVSWAGASQEDDDYAAWATALARDKMADVDVMATADVVPGTSDCLDYTKGMPKFANLHSWDDLPLNRDDEAHGRERTANFFKCLCFRLGITIQRLTEELADSHDNKRRLESAKSQLLSGGGSLRDYDISCWLPELQKDLMGAQEPPHDSVGGDEAVEMPDVPQKQVFELDFDIGGDISYEQLDISRKRFMPGPQEYWAGETPLQRKAIEDDLIARFDSFRGKKPWHQRLFESLFGERVQDPTALPKVNPRDIPRSQSREPTPETETETKTSTTAMDIDEASEDAVDDEQVGNFEPLTPTRQLLEEFKAAFVGESVCPIHRVELEVVESSSEASVHSY